MILQKQIYWDTQKVNGWLKTYVLMLLSQLLPKDEKRKAEKRVNVIRVGQLTGNSQNGVWNMTEAWPLMMSTKQALGCLPKLEQKLDWLHVEIAAESVIELSLYNSVEIQGGAGGGDEPLGIFHVLNSREGANWEDLLDWSK